MVSAGCWVRDLRSNPDVPRRPRDFDHDINLSELQLLNLKNGANSSHFMGVEVRFRLSGSRL